MSPNRRTLKEREKQEVQKNKLQNDSIRVWITPQKCSIYSIKGTIGQLLYMVILTYSWCTSLVIN